VADAPDAAGTKRSHPNRESTSQTDEDMAQIRKRVTDANKALIESGLAWSSGAEPEDAEDGEHDGEEEDEDEDDTQNEEESTDAADGEDSEEDDTLPPSPIAATSTHVWMVSLEQGSPDRETIFEIHGVFRHFNDALRVAATEIHSYGMGESESEGMKFEGPRGLREIAEKDGNDYSWRFEGGEGYWLDADLKRMLIM
jgi:hypothetical protein